MAVTCLDYARYFHNHPHLFGFLSSSLENLLILVVTRLLPIPRPCSSLVLPRTPYLLWQSGRETNPRQPEVVDAFYQLLELVQFAGLAEITAGMQLVAFYDIHFCPGCSQDNYWNCLQLDIRLHTGQDFPAIQFGHVQVEQDKVWTRTPDVISLTVQKGHRLYPVGSHMQTYGVINAEHDFPH
jgi:hypothetical protein